MKCDHLLYALMGMPVAAPALPKAVLDSGAVVLTLLTAVAALLACLIIDTLVERGERRAARAGEDAA